MPDVYIYTDGSVKAYDEKEGGFGGWAYKVLVNENSVLSEECEDAGGELATTNNRMELMAVLKALYETPCFHPNDEGTVTVYSDSQYIVGAFNEGWIEKWEKNGWEAKNGQIKNIDLWLPLIWIAKQYGDKLRFIHVKGHNGNHYNEIVDKLAQAEAEKLLLTAKPDVIEERYEKRRQRRRKTYPYRLIKPRPGRY